TKQGEHHYQPAEKEAEPTGTRQRQYQGDEAQAKHEVKRKLLPLKHEWRAEHQQHCHISGKGICGTQCAAHSQATENVVQSFTRLTKYCEAKTPTSCLLSQGQPCLDRHD